MHPRYKRHRNEKYLNFIRKKPSCISGRYREWNTERGQGRCDPSHTWNTGKNSFRNDYTAVPLTRDEHQKYADLGHDGFEKHYNIDLKDEIINLMAEYIDHLEGIEN